MRNAWAIFRREFFSFFVSPIAYVIITGFLLISGFFFSLFLGQFNMLVQRYQQYQMMGGGGDFAGPNLNQWVIEVLFRTLLVVLVFLIPFLTMRIMAEEKRRGTFELLLTSPVSVGEVVIGKFMAVSAVICIMLSLSFAFPMFLCIFAKPEILPVLSGMLGLLLCALGFASVGMAVSSFTENQIVAGIISMVTLLFLFFINAIGESLGGATQEILNFLSPGMQLKDMLRGVITLQTLAYFISLISLGMFLSFRALESYRWR